MVYCRSVDCYTDLFAVVGGGHDDIIVRPAKVGFAKKNDIRVN